MFDKSVVEAVLVIIIFFLSVLLLFVILGQDVTLHMIIGALASTYVFVHYWEKKYHKTKKK